MTFIMSKRFTAVSAATLFVSIIVTCHREAVAFAPAPQICSSRYHARVKGRENTAICSSIATPPDSKVSASTTATKTTGKKRKQRPKKAKKQLVAVKKSVQKKSRSKGKNKNITKSFKPLKDLKPGSKISGKVVDVCDFGVFVDIGYATRGSRAGTALLHISQIRDEKIADIRDVVKVGDAIEGARVLNIDLKKGEVGLSLRSRRKKRRDTFATLKVGDAVEGKVDSVVSYGVFVDVGTNVNALLHISRITGGSIENVRHHLNEGDPVSVHVIDMDQKKKTMAVSMLDKKADQYLDRRMSQRLKRFYGTAAPGGSAKETPEEETSELDYFDQAIRELEDALSGRKE